jgi:acetolactate synthase-1/2/3 large subunit
VVAIAGDGGFMYNVQELATAVQHGLGVVTVVFNDGAYGNVRRMQIEDHGGRVIASDLRNPDFVKLAESFGAQGLRARNPEELRVALRRGLATAGPTLIDVPVGDFPSPWEFIQFPAARPRRA